MAKTADQFAGHVFNGDPRSLLTAAFACTWPTMPAYRYRIHSADASGQWSVWNDGGALVELVSPIGEHNLAQWQLVGWQPPFEFVRWSKLPSSDELSGYTWQLWWKLLNDPLNLIDHLAMTTGRCNVNIPLPDWASGPSFPGSFGLTAQAEQVVYNETLPPA